ncbi:TetR/AcrR family transcriptional regulator [Planomonospora venezuelensis]|uniref:AcrR family transcriptional regulator n=1 Tax=Planomonospora venezuelensis TaxID=1999 RepID=A0A841CZH2_PLAVE|nr:TetR/AcrR family transcriptional regulator [Planomonospora venezuelensis]MBB5963792.1 AcrR family transcriptional regulator [Planomonospora venezuelensis]
MSAEDRRAMITAATLPLVTEYGAAVTTSRIARAAGIGEGTIFRVFTDKDDLLQACLSEAMNPEHVLRELASIPLDDPLTDRLVQAAEALRAHLERMGAVIGALHASGHRRGRAPGDQPAPGGREASMKATHEAVTELIEPDRAALRLEPETIASVFLGMLSPSRPASGQAGPSPQTIVDVLLHGVLAHGAFAAPGSPA